MKYILIFFLLFLLGCENKTSNNEKLEQKIEKTTSNKIKKDKIPKIKIKDLTFYQKDKISYSFKTNKVLVFLDNSEYSNLQKEELNKLKIKYYVIHNPILEEFFEIKKYPTIIITKSNKQIKRYEGFIPAQILKYEIKD